MSFKYKPFEINMYTGIDCKINFDNGLMSNLSSMKPTRDIKIEYKSIKFISE